MLILHPPGTYTSIDVSCSGYFNELKKNKENAYTQIKTLCIALFKMFFFSVTHLTYSTERQHIINYQTKLNSTLHEHCEMHFS